MPILSVKDLKTRFYTRNGVVYAVDGVSFDLEKGETLGIVGESGSGKSVTCYSIMGLIPQPPGRIDSGSAHFEGTDLLKCSQRELRGIRGKRISMIFQDPMTSLNPYLKIGKQLIEPLRLHDPRISRADAMKKAAAALEETGIHDPVTMLNRYPHEFSGGMRQRVMIAMALITQPDLLIADEPTTALDVTVQAQILQLISDLQQSHGMAVIMITHDLGVIAGSSDRVLVMYAGRIVESAATAELFADPRHPYTRSLEQSIPGTHSKGEKLFTIPGLPPALNQEFKHCAFAERCSQAADRCRKQAAELKEVAPGHLSACIRIQDEEISLASTAQS